MRDGQVIADEPVLDRRIAADDLVTLTDLDEQGAVEVTI
jgi:hypothetical protein